MPSITRRPKGSFLARVYVSGFPRQTRSFTTLERAQTWAVATEASLHYHRAVERRALVTPPVCHPQIPLAAVEEWMSLQPSPESPPSLLDALARYAREITPQKKGAANEERRIRQWQRHPLATFALSDIRGYHLAKHRDDRTSAGISPSTLQKEFAVLSHLYRIASTDWGFESLLNPVKAMRKPKVGRGRDRRLHLREETLLLEHCERTGNARLRSAIVVALETAMRRGELVGLQWSDVDLDAKMANLHDTKNGERRVVPLSTRAVMAFRLMENTGSGAVLGVHPDVITYDFHQACLACSLNDLRFHDLRHEATSRLFEKGFNMMEVATITGHKTLSMLKRYTHLRPSDLLARLG
jgi:integrase